MRSFLLTLLFGILTILVQAQPQLPEIAAVNQQGVVYVSWTNPYDGVKSIAVQRSMNKQNNFRSIGYVKDLKKGVQQFVDTKPTKGMSYYRVLLVFNSGVNWFSEITPLDIEEGTGDEANEVMLAKQDVQKLSSIIVTYDEPEMKMIPLTENNHYPTPKPLIRFIIPQLNEIEIKDFIPSEYVFTSSVNGYVQIQLPESDTIEAYTLDFFDNKNVRVLKVPAFTEHHFLIDKRNFQRKGIFRFELKRNDELFEEGYIIMN